MTTTPYRLSNSDGSSRVLGSVEQGYEIPVDGLRCGVWTVQLGEPPVTAYDLAVWDCHACGGEGIIDGLVVGDSIRTETCHRCRGRGVTVVRIRARMAPLGECAYCDSERAKGGEFFPAHQASDGCQSGKSSHCTCDTCF